MPEIFTTAQNYCPTSRHKVSGITKSSNWLYYNINNCTSRLATSMADHHTTTFSC